MDMQARLTDIDFNEVLMYLGYHAQEYDSALESQIRRCMETVARTSRPRLTYRFLDVLEGRTSPLLLPGNDVAALLSQCSKAVLMAATLGQEAESLLLRTQVSDLAKAVIMDSAQSAAIENVCENFQKSLEEEVSRQGLFITDRFSPGYGDLPLEIQDSVGAFLEMPRRIGVTVTANHLMIPRKSVTCIIGISDRPQQRRRPGCEKCKAFQGCTIRRNGGSCNG